MTEETSSRTFYGHVVLRVFECECARVSVDVCVRVRGCM